MRLGTCWYPEHWPEAWWPEDVRAMAAMGLTRVRIGEFAWSRIEPARGEFAWDWLDRAIEMLHASQLGVILGTPTATPPKWLIEAMPDMLACGPDGHERRFGSRRHYCFSHVGYRAEAARIVGALAHRYGKHPAVVAWQTDNEYGCHDTAVSYSIAAAAGFRDWLAVRYGDVAALNRAWGTVFWSMEYASFAAIDPPNLTVTEPAPAHVLDWRRYSSDAVVAFNRDQVDCLRAASPGRDLMHNFMGFFTQFDHYRVSADLDVAGWDSYPLGFLDSFALFDDDDKLRYARTGHPDIAAFHHDLYRGMTGARARARAVGGGVGGAVAGAGAGAGTASGRWAVLEQQPGPVNWARHNPAPLAGMVRLWTLEALAHGAELVSYFRWRQLPFGQEAMHAGLHRPDRTETPAAAEVRQVARELDALGALAAPPRQVAMIFSYEAAWMIDTQPHGRDFDYLELVFTMYTALRRLGLNIDLVGPGAALAGYAMVVVPTLPILDDALVDALAALAVPVLFGPRSGSKTVDFATPATMPPGPLQRHLPMKVTHVESLRDGLTHAGAGFLVTRWIDHLETDAQVEWSTDDGLAVVVADRRLRYLATWPDPALLEQLFTRMADEANIACVALPRDLRLRRTAGHGFAFNYGPDPACLDAILPHDAQLLVGTRTVASAGVVIWRLPHASGGS